MNKVWIVMYTESNTGEESIIGVYSSETKAKLSIADYVLDEDIITDYLELVEKEVVS